MKLVVALLVLVACASDTFTTPDAGGGDAPTCPNESGKYTVLENGAGCATTNVTGVCAMQTGCMVTLGNSSLSGTFTIDENGAFTGGTIKDGQSTRTGCTGTWNAATSQLTIDCGGTTGSQSCIATMTRAASCN